MRTAFASKQLSRILDPMAEISTLANLVAVVGAGLKLSMALYDIGSLMSAAGRDMKALGVEISFYCRVLEQVHAVLNNKQSLASENAIQTAEDVLRRTEELFNQLTSILEDLKSPIGFNTSLDLLTRMKWVLKQSKIRVLRETFKSFTGVLRLML